MITYNYTEVNGQKTFYREAGDKSAPTIVLLHGFRHLPICIAT
jgi:pimeloyl-ACP methyl ester carboxylesterase